MNLGGKKMKERKYDATVHYVMAICGGFLGVYGIINRLSVFGSAQTANLISVIGDLVGKNLSDVVLRIGAFLIYISAIVLATILEKKTTWHLKYIVIGVEFLAICILSFFPENMNPILALYPIFFVSAFQWCVFKGAKGYVSSTIFSTNNLKQAFSAWTEYYLINKENTKEKKEKAIKAKFFGGTLISFHIGVLLGYLTSLRFGLESIWFCMPILGIALGLLIIDDNIIKRYVKEKEQKIHNIETYIKEVSR